MNAVAIAAAVASVAADVLAATTTAVASSAVVVATVVVAATDAPTAVADTVPATRCRHGSNSRKVVPTW